jgi:hypothetical protein
MLAREILLADRIDHSGFTATCSPKCVTKAVQFSASSLETSCMHLTTEEALSLLDIWRTERTVLQVYFSGVSASRELQATVSAILPRNSMAN